jgi:hypothetical protein
LGAGTGLGCIFAKKPDTQVVSTDGSKQFIQKLQKYFSLNDVEIDTTTFMVGRGKSNLAREMEFCSGC